MIQTRTDRFLCGPTLCFYGLVWSYIMLRGPLYSHVVLIGSSGILDYFRGPILLLNCPKMILCGTILC